jgi:hypothetical protein
MLQSAPATNPKKPKSTEDLEQAIKVEVSNPTVTLPAEIRVGLSVYRVDMLILIGRLMIDEKMSLSVALSTATEQLKISVELMSYLNALTNTLRRWYSIPIRAFHTLEKEQFNEVIYTMQRQELIRQLLDASWRAAAIAAAVNTFFPGLPPITVDAIISISEAWDMRTPYKIRTKKPALSQALVRAKKTTCDHKDDYRIAISGSNIQYTQLVSKDMAKEILKLALSED